MPEKFPFGATLSTTLKKDTFLTRFQVLRPQATAEHRILL